MRVQQMILINIKWLSSNTMILFLKHHGFDNGLYMCTFYRVFGSQGKLIIQIILKIRNLSR